MTTYPANPAKSLLLAEIAIQLEGIQSDSFFAESIFIAIRRNSPANEIVQMIYDQSKDNRPLVSHIVGEKVLLKIEKYFEL